MLIIFSVMLALCLMHFHAYDAQNYVDMIDTSLHSVNCQLMGQKDNPTFSPVKLPYT